MSPAPTGTRNDTARPTTTRDRLLSATAQVLSAKGYSETRLTDIAEVAGLRAPAVYHYFSSREELVAEVMTVGQRLVREHVTDALAALPAGTGVVERIETAVEAHLLIELQLSEFATAVTRNAGQLPDDLRDRVRDEGTAYHALWRDLLEQARTEGLLRTGLDPRAARMLVIGALNWTAEWWSPRQSPLPVLVRTAQSLVSAGLFEP
ncbi:TetR/AcrR family transcriptional regulator [Streptomyces fuscichromogenes]|uniref:TetR/AcrR family transcriptional regulator n=1 Tax=Streptomyces fuscichromogenes TaxID=1324013 RepID=UPI00381BC328